jgi:hypothetical protein
MGLTLAANFPSVESAEAENGSGNCAFGVLRDPIGMPQRRKAYVCFPRSTRSLFGIFEIEKKIDGLSNPRRVCFNSVLVLKQVSIRKRKRRENTSTFRSANLAGRGQVPLPGEQSHGLATCQYPRNKIVWPCRRLA